MFNACVLLQLTLCVKAPKKQVDEVDAEAERQEGMKRKAIRDMEEMQKQKRRCSQLMGRECELP